MRCPTQETHGRSGTSRKSATHSHFHLCHANPPVFRIHCHSPEEKTSYTRFKSHAPGVFYILRQLANVSSVEFIVSPPIILRSEQIATESLFSGVHVLATAETADRCRWRFRLVLLHLRRRQVRDQDRAEARGRLPEGHSQRVLQASARASGFPAAQVPRLLLLRGELRLFTIRLFNNISHLFRMATASDDCW